MIKLRCAKTSFIRLLSNLFARQQTDSARTHTQTHTHTHSNDSNEEKKNGKTDGESDTNTEKQEKLAVSNAWFALQHRN